MGRGEAMPGGSRRWLLALGLLALALAHNALALPGGVDADVDILASEEVVELSNAAEVRGTEAIPKNPANKTTSTPASKVHFSATMVAGSTEPIYFKGTRAEEEEEDIGELSHSMSSEEAEKAAVKIQKKLKRDPANTGLFDLAPVFKGILADKQRRKGLVMNCVNSMKLWVSSTICQRRGMAKMLPKSNVTDVKFEGAGSGSGSGKKISTLMELRLGAAQADYVMGKALVAKGAGPGSAGDLKKCRKYAVRPMSFAMRSLWASAQRNFCSNSRCDATLCYSPSGPLGRSGYPKKKYHTFRQLPLNVVHNKTSSGKTIVQQMVDVDMSLEKMSLCEKIAPSLLSKNKKGFRKPGQCKVTRRCRIINARLGECLDGSRANKAVMDCPTDKVWVKNLMAAQQDLAMMLCNRA